MMGVADKVSCVRLFNNSSKRQIFCKTEINSIDGEKRAKLKALCRTRWVQRHDTFEVFVDLYPAIIDALNAILDVEKRPDAIIDTNAILQAITTFQFVVTLLVVKRCLEYLKALSISLQERALDVVEALKNVHAVRDIIQDKKRNIDNFHKVLFSEATDLAAKVGVEPVIPRRCGRQTTRTNTPADSPEVYNKRTVTIPFLNHLVQQFSQRFMHLQERAAMALLLIPPVTQDLDAASLDYMYFLDDLPSPDTLQVDVECWRRNWSGVGREIVPSILSGSLIACNKNFFFKHSCHSKDCCHFPSDKLFVRAVNLYTRTHKNLC